MSVIRESDIDKLRPPQVAALLDQLRKMPTAAGEIAKDVGRADPRDFVRDVLGARPTPEALAAGYTNPWTPDQELVMVSFMENRRTAVPSGHGVGKTRVSAWLVLWYLYSHSPSRVITTAPTDRQVEELLWAEIRVAFETSKTKLPGRLLTTKLELAPNWYAIGFTSRTDVGDISATKFQGFHSPNMAIVFDEATGVEETIWEGAEGMAMRPSDRFLAIGNPTDPAAKFAVVCKSPSWKMIQLDCHNHPNVLHDNPDIVPGAVTREWVDERLEEYGDIESPLYRSKVRGLWPQETPDALIQLGWVEAAQKRRQKIVDSGEDFELDTRGCALGVDVAGVGTDNTVLSKMDSNNWWIPEVKGKPAFYSGRDTDATIEMIENACLEDHRIRIVVLDDTGLGSGVTAGLRKKQRDKKLFCTAPDGSRRPIWIFPVNFSSVAIDNFRFEDVKDEMWWHLREWLRVEKAVLPTDQEMKRYRLPRKVSIISQLLRPQYNQSAEGRIIVYDKKGARGPRSMQITKNMPAASPDFAHSMMLSRYGWMQLREKKVVGARTTQEQFEADYKRVAEGRNEWKEKREKAEPSPWFGRR